MNVYVQTLLNAFGATHTCSASEAAGVLDIVRAARRLFGTRISLRFAIVGHSQGGQAALFAASHAPLERR